MKSTTIRALALAAALLALGEAASAGPRGVKASKVSPELTRLHDEREAPRASSGAGPFVSSNRLARIVDERVVIDAVADGDARALAAALVSLGMTNPAVVGRVVSGQLPIDAIPGLGSIAHLRSARPSYAIRRVGAATSQGDVAQRSNAARASFGVSGAGVKVGVLSDSYNCLGGAAHDVQTGDLPDGTQVIETEECGGATDEGRAMLQIVHDVAPGAPLAFAHTDGLAAFASNIATLGANGARVIVDDILFLSEPMFQDGIIAQAVDTVRAQGAAFFSAAGNDGRRSYESVFRPGDTFADGAFPVAANADVGGFFGGVAHNFGSAGSPDHFQQITLPPGRTRFVLQWDSPSLSACPPAPAPCQASPNDVDVYVLNAAATELIAGSTDSNTGADAFETFVVDNVTAAPMVANLMIVSYDEPRPGYVKYVYFSDAAIDEYATRSATNYGHSNADGAIAVGAVNFDDTPAFGVSPPVLAPSSSAGGTPIFFDRSGNRLAVPIIRRKPDISAPDGVETTFFPPGAAAPGTFPEFFGTSAAAPHAAGVAALLLSRQPDLTPMEIGSALAASAIPMGPGALPAAGSWLARALPADFNFDSGYGLIQADAALALSSTRVFGAAATLPTSRAPQVGHTVTAFATVINGGAVTAHHVSIRLASDLPGTFTYQTADPANNPTGTPNTPVNIAPGQAQSFVIAFTPSAAFDPTTAQLVFAGANLVPVTPVAGLNTLRLVATSTPGPDVIALAATQTPGLTVDLPGPGGAAAFAVATSNVGAAGSVTVSASAGSLPVSVSVCRTDAGPCLAAPSVTIDDIAPGATPTFSFFVQGLGVGIPFDPAHGRIFAVFANSVTGHVVGETSVAVRTSP